MMNKNLKLALGTVLLIFILIALSFLMLQGSGLYPIPGPRDILLLAILIAILSSSKKAFYWLLLPVALLNALYTPVGLNFGKPSYSYIMSLFATDAMESKEFLQQIPFTSYLSAVAIPILLILFRKISEKCGVFLYKNKLFLCLAIVFAMWDLAPMKFIQTGYKASVEVGTELDRLNSFKINSEWGLSALSHSKYDDYVLIIGESARKDYHHAYGYPVKNTPFMDNAKGELVDGFTSAGTNTVSSLHLMLTKPDTQNWQPNYNLNVVDLVKSAGIQTYWLSNQGAFGEYDTPVSVIANQSQYRVFLKIGGYASNNKSDMELLPELQKVLHNNELEKRFIVLHLYGSHPMACDRLKSDNYPTIFDENQLDIKHHYINCYISSIKKTDDLLATVYAMLKENQEKTGRTFSMLYFSDHGMAHNYEGKSIIINNSYFSKLHFDVPLFKISSDDNRQKIHRTLNPV
ncbi:glucan phosphoethanolaminetransferase (alkaline phosphatase superfamily) [Cricetibacter osteomyelitidis]|uniref:Glucan phosphoethanolaminetransferase (Alkaline phosphatase superfamily) n=1 Tax=Cricetibacter osteomyelitidis TaxID=1521931 RepID=A0A4R2T3U6_9PAST|nr:glucan phosphoethanolaminetransferase (alkaline phosphatase superfamily) [Cricetibacter osteomyelitidis]